MKTESRRMPRCLGIYQSGDKECDGESNGKTEQDRMPCVFRDRCVGFQKYLERTKCEPKAFIRFQEVPGDPGRVYAFARHPEKLEKNISREISLWGIRNGRPTRRRTAPPEIVTRKTPKISPEHMAKLRANKPPSRSALRLGGKARSKQLGETRERATELAAWYTKKIAEHTGRTVHDVQAAARPGDLFLIDRTETAGYVSVYARKTDGGKVAITSIYHKSLSGRVELRLALDLPTFEASVTEKEFAKIAPEDFSGKDGAFKVRVRNVDMEKASMVAEGIAHAMKHGEFDIPDSE